MLPDGPTHVSIAVRLPFADDWPLVKCPLRCGRRLRRLGTSRLSTPVGDGSRVGAWSRRRAGIAAHRPRAWSGSEYRRRHGVRARGIPYRAPDRAIPEHLHAECAADDGKAIADHYARGVFRVPEDLYR